MLREAVAELPDTVFAAGTRAEAEAKLRALDDKVQAVERELERRRRQRAVEEAQAELAAL
jgi:hypothetical protein